MYIFFYSIIRDVCCLYLQVITINKNVVDQAIGLQKASLIHLIFFTYIFPNKQFIASDVTARVLLGDKQGGLNALPVLVDNYI